MRTKWIAVLVVTVLFVAAAWARVRTVAPTGFSANGSLISGWYWLRASGHSAQWDFDPARILNAEKVYINFNPLVTNGVNGGSGYDTTCKIVLDNGKKKMNMSINVVNPFRPEDPSNSGGIGYQCYGHSSSPIPSAFIRDARYLKITISYPFPANRHVAVNRDCMYLGVN